MDEACAYEEAERAKVKKKNEWMRKKLLSMGWIPTPYGMKSPPKKD